MTPSTFFQGSSRRLKHKTKSQDPLQDQSSHSEKERTEKKKKQGYRRAKEGQTDDFLSSWVDHRDAFLQSRLNPLTVDE